MAGRYWDDHIVSLAAKVVEQRSGTVVDVGGHFGSSSVAFSHFFPKVFCFEPNDFNFRVLRAASILNGMENLTIYNNGLYSKDVALSMADESAQEIPLPIDATGIFDGISSDNLGAYSFSECGSGLFKHSARTLESYHFSDVAFIKIDVQGADGEVLLGAMATISDSLPVIVFQWEMDLSKHYSVDLFDMKTRLLDMGYVIDKLKVHNSKQTDYVCLPPWFKN
ncbi:MAG TPA: FkbM family methyltransferase [Xylella sp.]